MQANHLPEDAPLEYDLVRDIPLPILRNRLILLHHFSELISPNVAMFPMEGEGSLDQLREILVYSVKEASFRKVNCHLSLIFKLIMTSCWFFYFNYFFVSKVIQTTMVRDRQHGPVIELNRIQVKRSRSKGGLAGPDGMKSVFGQMVNKMSLLTQESLFLPHRVWKVKFVGESVDDCGGGELKIFVKEGKFELFHLVLQLI